MESNRSLLARTGILAGWFLATWGLMPQAGRGIDSSPPMMKPPAMTRAGQPLPHQRGNPGAVSAGPGGRHGDLRLQADFPGPKGGLRAPGVPGLASHEDDGPMDLPDEPGVR